MGNSGNSQFLRTKNLLSKNDLMQYIKNMIFKEWWGITDWNNQFHSVFAAWKSMAISCCMTGWGTHNALFKLSLSCHPHTHWLVISLMLPTLFACPRCLHRYDQDLSIILYRSSIILDSSLNDYPQSIIAVWAVGGEVCLFSQCQKINKYFRFMLLAATELIHQEDCLNSGYSVTTVSILLQKTCLTIQQWPSSKFLLLNDRTIARNSHSIFIWWHQQSVMNNYYYPHYGILPYDRLHLVLLEKKCGRTTEYWWHNLQG